MKKLVLIMSALFFALGVNAQANIADARTFGIGQTVTVTGIATNGSELGSIRYMQDGTAGLAGYGGPITGVSRGDSITVTGPLIEFSGLLEISTVTNVTNHGQAVVPPAPLQIPIPSANESLESQLAEIQNVTFVETGNFAANTTYTITDGGNMLDVRINTGTNMVGTPIPTGAITITGLIGQFNTNYQIVPRDLNDIIAYVPVGIEINVQLEGATVLNNSDYFIGNNSSINVIIENQGASTMTLTGATFTGADAADFSSNIGATTIGAFGSQSFTINYSPSTIGSHFASIEIGSDDPNENPYIINFEGVGTDDLATEPIAGPTALTFPLLEAYTLGGQYTAGTGATKYLVLWKNGSAVTGVPNDMTTYMRGDIVGDARVAYVGAGTSFTPRGIVASQDYHFAVYAFNGQGGFENYLTSSPATGNVTSLGQNIGSYYSGISSGATTFADDLNTLINPHTQITYFMYKQTMMNDFEIRDTTNGQSYVTCVYSGEKKVFDDPFDWTATGYSREHTFAHSWMPTWPANSPEQPEYTDQHNLYPANLAEANTPRSNLPLGDIVGTPVFSYLEGAVGQDANNQMVYEPRDAQKGNAARAIMYMAIAYDFPLTGDLNSDKQDQDVLKAWHFGDLPDNYEIARNEYIFDLQGNRNPFIDSVHYVCFIDFDDNVHIPNPSGCDLSLEEKVQNNLVVFPVPSDDRVYIQVNGTDIESYKVFDMQGRVVLSDDSVNLPLVELMGNTLGSGSYIISVDTPYGSARRKMIIE